MAKSKFLLLTAILSLTFSACASNKKSSASINSESSSEGNSSSVVSSSSSSSESEAKGYTVKFETNGGTPIADMVNVTYIETSPVTTREGYTFLDWYRNASFLTKINFPYTVTKDLTLYAKWEEKETIPEGEKMLTVDSGINQARAYVSASYEDSGLQVKINVRDKILFTSHVNSNGTLNGMNDNIELFVSPTSHQTVGLLSHKTIKIMVVPKVGFEVRYFLYSEDGFVGSFVYDEPDTTTGITTETVVREVTKDGYPGYSSTITIPYTLFSLNKETAIGNMALFLAMRNTDSSNLTVYGESEYLCAQRRNAWTHLYVDKDGKFFVKDVDTIICGDSYTDSQFFRTLSTDFKDKEIYGAGISGSKASEWNSDLKNYFERIVLHHPKKLIMHIGVNDIHSSGDKNGELSYNTIMALMGKFHGSLSNLQIYWVTITNNFFGPCMSGGLNLYSASYEYVNSHMKTYASTVDYLKIIDLASTLPYEKSVFIDDGLHLNPMGYNIFAKLIYQTLGLTWVDGTLFGDGGVLPTSRGYDLSNDASGVVTTNGESDQYAFIKTEGEHDFTFEATLTVKHINNGDKYPKVGIVIKNGNKVLFFHIEMFKDLVGKQVGYVIGESYEDISGWSYHWPAELSEELDIKYTDDNYVKLGAYVNDATLTLSVNDGVVFTIENFIHTDRVSFPGLMSFNTAFEAKNITFSNN